MKINILSLMYFL